MAARQGMGLMPSPAKRSRKSRENVNTCIICQISDVAPNLVTPTSKGEATLYKCMIDTNDDVCRNAAPVMSEAGFTEPIKYHRSCYQSYTSKENITHKDNPCSPQTPSSSTSQPVMRTRVSSTPFMINKCIICNCGKKHGDSQLVQVRTQPLQTTIKTAAMSISDTELLIKVQYQDLIALEAKYHKNCLAQLLVRTERSKTPGAQTPTESEAFTQAFDMLVREIQDDLAHGRAFDMTALLAKYKIYLDICGHVGSDTYRAEKLKKRLAKYFQGSITFHTPPAANSSEMIYSSTIDVRETINKIAEFQKRVTDEAIEEDMQLPQDTNYEDLSMFHAATLLRSSAKKATGISINPCIDSKDISLERAESLVPGEIYHFLSLVMLGKPPELVQNIPTAHRRVLAVAQDIIYCATNSRCKTPKHSGLAMSIHHLTRSRVLLDLLHNMGHCLSYDDVCRLETATATNVMTSMAKDEAFLPSNIAPGQFTHAAMDNIDINEATRDGQGTTHVLGSLLYQDGPVSSMSFGPRPKAANIRNKGVSTLKCLDIQDCPNKFVKKPALNHLLGKIDLKSWFATTQPTSLTVDREWAFIRMCPTKIFSLEFEPIRSENQCVPSWGGFHAILKYNATEQKPKTTIGYNPVVPGLPIHMDTMYTGLKKIEKQMETIGQETPVITLDLQLYIIAQEIRIRNWDELKHHVYRLGGFHIMELYWKILGKRYAESGLEDVLVEAQVFGKNAASVIMQGKHYKRCTIAHRLMFEAMSRMQWQSFFAWMVRMEKIPNTDDDDVEVQCQELQKAMKEVVIDGNICDPNQKKAVSLFSSTNDTLHKLQCDFTEFIELGKKQNSTFHFWELYLQDIQLALDYMAAEKIPKWEQHLNCFTEIVCYAFAYDRHNYARWGPVYLSEMFLLPDTAPAVHEQFAEGRHVVKRSKLSSFNGLWSDLGLEQTVVKDSKSKQTGIIGISRQENATLKWYLTVHERSAILRQLKYMSGVDNFEDQIHHDLRLPAMRKDSDDVQKIVNIILDRYGNPFAVDEETTEEPGPLINISTGVVAPSHVTSALLMAKERGKTSSVEFIEARLNTNAVSLSEPIKQLKLPTFKSIHRRVKLAGNAKSMESDRQLFSRLLVISRDRDIDLPKFFEYELSSHPLAIANADGSLTKTNKAQTLRDLETIGNSSLDPDAFMKSTNIEKHSTTTFIDHMGCFHKLISRAGIRTFGDLIDGLTQFIQTAFKESDTVQVVSDRYDCDISVKAGERKRRGNTCTTGAPEIKITSRDQVLPRNMKTYISNPQNKDNFNNFAFDEWSRVMPTLLASTQTLVLAGGFTDHERVVEITTAHVSEVPELFCTQEEADGRIFLHIQDARTRYNTENAVIWSPDTDVLVLGTYFVRELGLNVWFRTGIKQKVRYIPLHAIADKLGSSLTNLLLSFHTLTGCDSTSCFKGKGKKKALHLLRKHQEEFQRLEELGDSFEIAADITELCMKFVCRLYQTTGTGKITDINVLRYKLFCKQAKNNYSLPPCMDSLVQHIKRANFQCALWKMALQSRPYIESPNGRGWTQTGQSLEPKLMTQASGPKELMELTTCRCSKSKCASQQCKCAKMKMRCTQACTCGGDQDKCENAELDEIESDTDSDTHGNLESDEDEEND